MIHPNGEFYENMTSAVPNHNSPVVQIPAGLEPRGLARQFRVRSTLTPDFSTLKFMKTIPLFIYGTEMENGIDNGLLNGATYLGKAHTLDSKYWMKQSSVHPIVFDHHVEGHKDNRRVRGEVYSVRVEHIHLLDVLHRNRISVRRTLRNIVFEDTMPVNASHHTISGMGVSRCFMYLGSNKYWKDYDLRLRVTTNFVARDGLRNTPFYEWYNWAQEHDDDWGWYGRFGGAGHVG